MRTPPASYLLRQAAGLAKGAARPGHAAAGSVTDADVLAIARLKAADVPHVPLASVARSVAATARSMGVTVVGGGGGGEGNTAAKPAATAAAAAAAEGGV
jgi:large subunit ribosomal protein L11